MKRETKEKTVLLQFKRYRIVLFDPFNFAIQEHRTIKGKPKWVSDGYYGNLYTAICSLMTLRLLANEYQDSHNLKKSLHDDCRAVLDELRKSGLDVSLRKIVEQQIEARKKPCLNTTC